MELKEFFTVVGGNYERTTVRLAGEELVRHFLHKFPGDPSYGELKTALGERDLPVACCAAYALSGVAANLGLDALARSASALTKQLHAAQTLPPQEVIDAVDGEYRLAVESIGTLLIGD